jgi:hypothetical protein
MPVLGLAYDVKNDPVEMKAFLERLASCSHCRCRMTIHRLGDEYLAYCIDEDKAILDKDKRASDYSIYSVKHIYRVEMISDVDEI